MFLDMQEHPEKYSDQQIEAMLNELDRKPDVEAAWQRFKSEKVFSFFTYRKIAASFIGVILLSGIAFAAIHIWNHTLSSSPKGEGSIYIQTSDTIKHSTPLSNRRGVGGEATIIFENVPLDSMLMEMADYYHVGVEFTRKEASQFRFHFAWKRSESLDRVLERLSNFEAVNLEKRDTVIIVE